MVIEKKRNLAELEQDWREAQVARLKAVEEEQSKREQWVQAKLEMYTAKATYFIAGQEGVYPEALVLQKEGEPAWLVDDDQALHGIYAMEFCLYLDAHLPITVEIDFGYEAGEITKIDYGLDRPWRVYHYGRLDHLYCRSLGQALTVAAEQYQVKLEEDAHKAEQDRRAEEREQDRQAAQAWLFEQVAADPVALALVKLFLAISEERESFEAMAEEMTGLVETLELDQG